MHETSGPSGKWALSDDGKTGGRVCAATSGKGPCFPQDGEELSFGSGAGERGSL